MRALPLMLVLVLATAPSVVPPSARAGVALGLKGGLAAATLHGDLPSDNATRYGVTAGLALTIGAGPVSFQPELLFVMKGTLLGSVDMTDAFGNPLGTVDVTAAVDYLELPLLARLRLPAGGPLTPYLLAGPTVGVRVSQKIKLSGVLNVSAPVEDFRGADLGLALGPGLELGRGRVRGTLEMRYTLGLTPASVDLYSDNARNGAFAVMAGLVLRP